MRTTDEKTLDRLTYINQYFHSKRTTTITNSLDVLSACILWESQL